VLQLMYACKASPHHQLDNTGHFRHAVAKDTGLKSCSHSMISLRPAAISPTTQQRMLPKAAAALLRLFSLHCWR
jgi:hypothetical protein